jgi:hypothetical protein
MSCPSCGYPLPGTLPEDDSPQVLPLDQPQDSSERLTMLEIGPSNSKAASEELFPNEPIEKPVPAMDVKGRVSTAAPLVGEKGVVEDDRDPMEILNRHDPYDPYYPYGGYRNDPLTISPYVSPHYRRYLFFAHIIRLVFALALLAFFYFNLWPALKPITEFEIEGIGMSWYSDALFLVAGGLVLVIIVYAVSYFIIYRPFGRRNPRDGS